jgi:hydroxyacylglutathione hydrolase
VALLGSGSSSRKHGLRIAYAAETHLHADFLSGVRQLAADRGTHILASAAGWPVRTASTGVIVPDAG